MQQSYLPNPCNVQFLVFALVALIALTLVTLTLVAFSSITLHVPLTSRCGFFSCGSTITIFCVAASTTDQRNSDADYQR